MMLGFGEAVRLFYANYTNPDGRAQRSAFWWVQFYQSLMLIVFGIVIFMAEGGPNFFENLPKLLTPEEFPVLWGNLGFSGKAAGYCILAFSLANFLPGIMLSIRRFHDLDRPGWWVLAFFIASNIPLTSIPASLANIIWFVFQGTHGSNRYGPDPLGPNSDVFH